MLQTLVAAAEVLSVSNSYFSNHKQVFEKEKFRFLCKIIHDVIIKNICLKVTKDAFTVQSKYPSG